jgi:hypothetical protein
MEGIDLSVSLILKMRGKTGRRKEQGGSQKSEVRGLKSANRKKKTEDPGEIPV